MKIYMQMTDSDLGHFIIKILNGIPLILEKMKYFSFFKFPTCIYYNNKIIYIIK